MKYYQYDSKTKKYLGEGKCQICQIERKALFPKDSTDKKPPQFDQFQTPYFENNEWVLKDSAYEVNRKCNLTNANGVKLYKKVDGFAVEVSKEDIEKKEKEIKAEKNKSEALNLKYQLREEVLDRLILNAMTKDEIKYLADLEKIISSENADKEIMPERG